MPPAYQEDWKPSKLLIGTPCHLCWVASYSSLLSVVDRLGSLPTQCLPIRLRSPLWEFCKTGEPTPDPSFYGRRAKSRSGMPKVNFSVFNHYRYRGLEMPLQKVRGRLGEGDPVIWEYLNRQFISSAIPLKL